MKLHQEFVIAWRSGVLELLRDIPALPSAFPVRYLGPGRRPDMGKSREGRSVPGEFRSEADVRYDETQSRFSFEGKVSIAKVPAGKMNCLQLQAAGERTLVVGST